MIRFERLDSGMSNNVAVREKPRGHLGAVR